MSAEETEALAEVLSWASGEMTRYNETAHPDHNRWSWRGRGHPDWMRDHFRSFARDLLGSEWLAARDREVAAEALRGVGGCDHPGIGHGNWLHTGICPKCRRCKFIGHGPLCSDCYMGADLDPAGTALSGPQGGLGAPTGVEADSDGGRGADRDGEG